MKSYQLFAIALCLLLSVTILPRAHASISNQATKLTFSAPVEVPGMVLPAGTYWFSILPSPSTRNIVEVWNAHRTKAFAMILTVPDERLQPTGKTVIRFAERPHYSPQALHAWFYPGDNYGHEFVYPESQARRIAKRTGQPVLAMRDDLATNIKEPAHSASDQSAQALNNAQVKAVEPSGQEVNESAVVTPPNKKG